jgi:hypothetical protein
LKRPEPTIKAIAYSEDKLKFIGQKLANIKKENILDALLVVNAPYVMKSQPRWRVMTWVEFY